MDDDTTKFDPGVEDGDIKEGQSLVPPLEEDNDTPFSPPTDRTDDPMMESRGEGDTLDPTHQATDNATDIDSHELYDEGLSGAAEADEPNAGNAVTDYSPEDDSRPQE